MNLLVNNEAILYLTNLCVINEMISADEQIF